MATQLHFDEPDLVARLARLPSKLRVAFAALCAERQLPNYIQFSERSGWGNPNVLKDALESIWQDIQGQPLTKAELETILERCMASIPSDEEDTKKEPAYAQDAAASVAYTIRARLADDPQELLGLHGERTKLSTTSSRARSIRRPSSPSTCGSPSLTRLCRPSFGDSKPILRSYSWPAPRNHSGRA